MATSPSWLTGANEWWNQQKKPGSQLYQSGFAGQTSNLAGYQDPTSGLKYMPEYSAFAPIEDSSGSYRWGYKNPNDPSGFGTTFLDGDYDTAYKQYLEQVQPTGWTEVPNDFRLNSNLPYAKYDLGGSQTESGVDKYEGMSGFEKLVLGAIAAMGGGAAMSAMGGAGAAAGAGSSAPAVGSGMAEAAITSPVYGGSAIGTDLGFLGAGGSAAGGGAAAGTGGLFGAGGGTSVMGAAPVLGGLGGAGGGASTALSQAGTAFGGPPNPFLGQSVLEKIGGALGVPANILTTAKEFAPLLGVLASMGGGKPPSFDAGAAGNQPAEAKAFLEAVLPHIRFNSQNPGASSAWTRGPNGEWQLNQQLLGENANIYGDASSKLSGFIDNYDQNRQAPSLIDDVRGRYSDDLAKTIFNRTQGLQSNKIDEERRAMIARLTEQGFVPGNEGYNREMNRWEDNLGEMRGKNAMDAQIAAATQALNEAQFTNQSRNQGFTNTNDLQTHIASLLAGARQNAMEPLKALTTQGSAPTGTPGSAADLAQSKYTSDLAAFQSKTAQKNDLIQALLKWGLA